MKKKIITVLITVCALAAAGCGEKEISDKSIKISQYKGVEAEKAEIAKVKKEDIDNYLESVRAENRETITDRELKKGDIAEFEYTGKLKKEVFDEGTLTLGNGEQYVAGFEEGIYGHKLNETFELPITFPEGYGGEQKPELSGADVVFTIKITSIKDGKLPEIDDEFVKKVSKKSKTVEEYRKEIENIIKTSNEEVARTTLEDNAWKVVLENVTVTEYPKDRLKEATKQMTEQMKKMLSSYYGMTFDEYLEQSGMKEDEFEKMTEESAKEYLKQVLTAELIAEKEGLTPSEKEYKKLMKEYAEEYGYKNVEAMTEQIGEKQVKEVILQDRVKDFIADKCKQVEPKKEEKDTEKEPNKEETKNK